MKTIINSLKKINYRLYFSILLIMMFPTIYNTVRIFFLGAMPDDWGFNIASQVSWASLFYEVIQEALILPLFFILGKSIANKEEFENKVGVIDNRYNIFSDFNCYNCICEGFCSDYGPKY